MKLDIEKLASELQGLKGQLYDDALYEVALMEIDLIGFTDLKLSFGNPQGL